MTENRLPRIALVTTGGTIAGSGASRTGTSYRAGASGAAELLAAVPELSLIAGIEAFEACRIGSQNLDDAAMLSIARAVAAVPAEFDGIVVTHGTDTMEETAWFLSLVLPRTRPVVITGSMRPATALGADGPRNLWNAVLAAGIPETARQGVVLCMNDVLIRARDAVKCSSTKVEAFGAPLAGPCGVLRDGTVEWLSLPARSGSVFVGDHALPTLPPVGILACHPGMGAGWPEVFVRRGVKGIVAAGYGNGTLSDALARELAEAASQGVAVVRASRAHSGPVTSQGEMDDEALGFIPAGTLTPQKAAVLLRLALARTDDVGELRRIFAAH